MKTLIKILIPKTNFKIFYFCYYLKNSEFVDFVSVFYLKQWPDEPF